MLRYAMILAPMALLACGKDDEGSDSGSTGTDAGDGTSGGCEATALTAVDGAPGNGNNEYYYRGTVEFNMNAEDDSATIEVVDGSGNAVAGSVSSRAGSLGGIDLIFTPDSPLTPSTSYEATATTCGASGTISFSTSDVGTPLDGCDPTGDTFTIELDGARFLEPAGVAELLLDQLDDDILLGIESIDGSTLQTIGAVGSGGVQDYCNPSIPFPAAEFEDPYFQIGPQDVAIAVAGLEVEIANLSVSGDFTSDCSSVEGAVLAGQLDARILAPLVGELLGSGDSPDEVCALLINFGVECGACNDGENYCVDVLVDQISAGGGGTTIECIDEENCHENCADSTCADTSASACE